MEGSWLERFLAVKTQDEDEDKTKNSKYTLPGTRTPSAYVAIEKGQSVC
jgi:hypothetical protein